MEYGKVTRMLSHNLNESIVVYPSKQKPGYVYKFFNTKGDEYTDAVVARSSESTEPCCVRSTTWSTVKSPEDDHHQDCEPPPESAVAALEVDREMRRDVRRNGK